MEKLQENENRRNDCSFRRMAGTPPVPRSTSWSNRWRVRSCGCNQRLFAIIARTKAPEDWRTPRRQAFNSGLRTARSVLECGGPPPLWATRTIHPTASFPIRIHVKFIRHRNPIRLEPVNGFHHCRRSRAFKPCRRTPWILAGHRHQPVLHRVLMHIIQPRQI